MPDRVSAIFDRVFYPGHADNWDDILLRKAILDRLRPGYRVLEVGSGTGNVKEMNFRGLAAQVVGMTGVLVRTGKFRQDTLDRWAADEFAMQPNYVIDSVADLTPIVALIEGRLARGERP